MSETSMSETSTSESSTYTGPIQEIREPQDSLLAAAQVDTENGFEAAATVSRAEEEPDDCSGDGPLVDRLVRRQLAVIEDLQALDDRILGLLTTWQRERPAA